MNGRFAPEAVISKLLFRELSLAMICFGNSLLASTRRRKNWPTCRYRSLFGLLSVLLPAFL
jgi:hypothetical protein